MSKLILFDVDGTLIESSKVHSQAFSEAFVKVYGVDTTIDIIEHHGMTDPEIVFEVLGKVGLDEQTIKAGFQHCMKMLIESFNELVNRDGVVVLDGVRELLQELERRDMSLGLVTGNLESIARGKLKRVGLNRHFRIGAFGSDQLRRAGLVKLAITRAQESFGLQFSNNVFLFGDTPKDIRAGKEGGARTVGVTTGIYARERLEEAGADFVLEDLRDTKRVLSLIL